MASNVSNLGRAFCKVILYEKLPNLVVNTNKLRKSYIFALAMQDEQNIYKKTNFGIQYIAIPGPTGETVCGGVMPAICYEPVDNFMDSADPSSTVNNVVWKPMSWKDINSATQFKYTGHPVANMFFGLMSNNPEVELASNQTWTNAEKTIYTYRYSEKEFKESISPEIVTSSSGTSSASTTTATSVSGSGSGSGSSGGAVDAAETKKYVYQQNGGIGSWWGARTDPFKLYSGGFWVSVFAKPAFVSDDPDKRKASWICIKFNVDNGIPNGNNSPYFLLISNMGDVGIRYLYDKRITDIPINMPHLSEAFKNGEEIRVGLFTMATRLIVYTDRERYAAVDFKVPVTLSDPSSQNAPPKVEPEPYSMYIFRTKAVEVYGYGCSAYLNVSEMTFFKKSWMVLENVHGDDNCVGYKSPENDTGGVTKGTWSDGSLIAWNIGEEQYLQNNSFPMYAAQFSYYDEIDQVESSVRPIVRANITTVSSDGVTETVSRPSGDANCGMYNSYPKWGKMRIVRSNPASGVCEKRFWYVCFVTEDIKDDILSVKHERVGYPVMFNFFGKVDFASTENTGETMEQFSSLDITNDVISVEISNQLDTPDRPSHIQKSATINLYDGNGDHTQYLTRARGVKIWLKWDTSGSSGIDPLVDTPAFTGVAFGEKYSMRPGVDSITINCTDYWNIVERMYIKNSPFFDGFELVSVINDLAQRVGVFVQDDIDHANVGFYYLGSGFSFDKPMHRYTPDQNLKACMMSAIQMFPYYLWFDNQCILHVSIIPADFDWGQTGPGWDNVVYKYYYRNLGSIPHEHPEKLILNEINLSSTLSSSVYNSFMLTGVRRYNNQAIPATDSRPSSLLDPNAVGFLGFIAEKEHRQPALDDNSVWVYLKRLMKMFAAPGYQTEIQTVGHIPPYMCGEFIKILQTPANDQGQFRVTAIRQQYEAEKNSWLTNITAYQITQVSWNPEPTSP